MGRTLCVVGQVLALLLTPSSLFPSWIFRPALGFTFSPEVLVVDARVPEFPAQLLLYFVAYTWIADKMIVKSLDPAFEAVEVTGVERYTRSHPIAVAPHSHLPP